MTCCMRTRSSAAAAAVTAQHTRSDVTIVFSMQLQCRRFPAIQRALSCAWLHTTLPDGGLHLMEDLTSCILILLKQTLQTQRNTLTAQ